MRLEWSRQSLAPSSHPRKLVQLKGSGGCHGLKLHVIFHVGCHCHTNAQLQKVLGAYQSWVRHYSKLTKCINAHTNGLFLGQIEFEVGRWRLWTWRGSLQSFKKLSIWHVILTCQHTKISAVWSWKLSKTSWIGSLISWYNIMILCSIVTWFMTNQAVQAVQLSIYVHLRWWFWARGGTKIIWCFLRVIITHKMPFPNSFRIFWLS